MHRDLDALEADGQFFAALVDGDTDILDGLLAQDFVMIEVMGGSEVSRSAFLGAMDSGQLKFESIDPTERSVRTYGETWIVTGRTEMIGTFDGTPFKTRSRYTHIFIEHKGHCLMVAAQGTPIP